MYLCLLNVAFLKDVLDDVVLVLGIELGSQR